VFTTEPESDDEDGDGDGLLEVEDGHDSPVPADDRLAELRNERRYRLLLSHGFHPTCKCPPKRSFAFFLSFGISKHVPSLKESSPHLEPVPLVDDFEPDRHQFSTPPPSDRIDDSAETNFAGDVDTSALDLLTSYLLDAMMVEDYAAANEWLTGVDAVIVDASSDAALAAEGVRHHETVILNNSSTAKCAVRLDC
jgi:hypothetical protein